MGTKNTRFFPIIQLRNSGNQGFLVWEVSTRIHRVSSMLLEVGILLLWFVFHFWVENDRMFEFLSGVLRLRELCFA